jgi:hypothetical protein
MDRIRLGAQQGMVIAEWPSARDVARRLDVTAPYVHRLINTGRLRVVQTRLGWLIGPESVREFEDQRAARRKPAC